VLDAYQVAGTFDRLVTAPGFELPLISDIKTGASLDYSWRSFAVQLAGYSRANAIYKQGVAPDGSQDQRLPMPAVDQSNGLVFWLNAGTGQFEIFLVDLNAGWEGFEHSMWARGWSKAQPQSKYEPQGSLVPVLQASLDAINQSKAVADPEVDKTPEPVPPETVRDWLQHRIDVIGQHAQARTALGASWPKGTPTLHASNEHTPVQLDAIEKLLDAVEARYEIPFPETGKPEPVGQILNLFPGSSLINDNDAKDNQQ
jgi:hypothetical protein